MARGRQAGCAHAGAPVRKALRVLDAGSGSCEGGRQPRLPCGKNPSLLGGACGGRSVRKAGGRSGRATADGATGGDYERFNPEIEETLKAIDSGTYVGKTCTPAEYKKYVKMVLEE